MTSASIPGPWVRLDHHTLRIPVPAVYGPISDFTGIRLESRGFVAMAESDKEVDVPLSTRFAADVMTESEALRVLAPPTTTAAALELVANAGDVVVRAIYDTKANERWQNEAYLARRLLLVAGTRPAQPCESPFDLLLDERNQFAMMPIAAIP